MKPSLLNISKTMAFATAIGAASAAWATVFPGSTDFENEAVPDTTYTEGSAVISQIETPPDVASRPAHYPYESSRTNVLEIDTGADAPVFRNLNAAGTAEEGTIYVDMLVKPTAIFAPDASPTPGSTDKLLVYFKEYPAGTTNLCVYAGYDNDGLTKGECFLSSQLPVDKDTWYRLVIEAKTLQEAYPGFNVYLGGYGSDFLCKRNEDPDFYSLLIDLNNTENLLPSAVAKVGFAGSGFVDDFVASDIDPDAVVTVPFTLTWPSGVTPVSYTVDGGEVVAISGSSPCEITVTNGANVAFTFQNGDGVQKTLTATVAEGTVEGIDASSEAFTWAEYLGDAVDGTYQIDNLAELKLFQKGVAAGLVTSNETFKLTADVTLDAPWPGIGVQNGKDIYSTAAFDEAAFRGTFDGQNHTVSGFQMIGKGDNAEGLDYCGFFNSTYGATIQNFKIAYAGALFAADTTASTKESGATFVGVAKNSTLRNLTTVAGTVSCSKGFGGIVGYLTSGTTVDSCTNNVNMTSLANNKCGGIAMIAQGGSAVTIRNCQNNGTQTTGSSNSEYGAIVGYVGLDITIENCETTVGRFLKHQGSTVTLQGVNKGDATVLAYHGAATPGLNFATVDNGVATFVADNALALNGEYKVMASGATATFEFTDLGTISFDEALSTPTYAITSSGAAGIPTSDKKGDVTYYTAGYFPRTATAGQDGTAEHPFEIADLDDLQALRAAVAADVGRGLSYVQTADIALTNVWEGIGPNAGKDLVNGTNKNIPLYESEAFSGTYDGGNYTISNFQMANGCDYGALFNSVNNATIKNLKISWGASTLTPGSSGDTGATFVGVARGSTLQNLTTLAGTVTTVTAAKDMGGIVGYLMAGSTVDSCTNEINVASSGSSRKCGGIAIITQEGTGTATIRNCKNSGTVTATNKGGLVGYIGVATTIDGCENTAAVQLFHFQSGSVTASDVNKGNATVASNDKSGGVSGLYFATVDDSVATFVADNALALNGEYKVMSAGATATYAFAEAGTISFDTNLIQNVTLTITAAEGLDLTSATDNGVVTYTATAASTIPDWATDVTGQSVIDQEVSEKYADWAKYTAGSGADLTQDCSAQFLMNVPADASVILQIESINVTDDGTQIVIGATANGSTEINMAGINGILNVMVAAELGSWTKKSIPAANLEFVNNKAEVLIPATDGRFVKASVDYTKGGNSLTPVSGSGE